MYGMYAALNHRNGEFVHVYPKYHPFYNNLLISHLSWIVGADITIYYLMVNVNGKYHEVQYDTLSVRLFLAAFQPQLIEWYIE